jgi:hypothetical protein
MIRALIAMVRLIQHSYWLKGNILQSTRSNLLASTTLSIPFPSTLLYRQLKLVTWRDIYSRFISMEMGQRNKPRGRTRDKAIRYIDKFGGMCSKRPIRMD